MRGGRRPLGVQRVGHAGARPPRRPAYLDRLPLRARRGTDTRCCRACPMVTTSLQRVHARPSNAPVRAHRRPADRSSSNGGDVEEAGTSLAELVRSAARRRPGAPAVVAGDQRLSWAELDAAVDRAAAGYAARELAAGDRVAIQLP